MIRLTLDTNIIRDLVEPHRPGHANALRLLELHEQGVCEIQVASRYEGDVPDGPIREMIDALPVMDSPHPGGPFRLGVSLLGGPDMLVGDDYDELETALMDMLFPGADRKARKHQNRLFDIDHLVAHKWSGRDVFITCDRAILERQQALFDGFAIKVMSPEQFLREGGF